MLVKAKKPATLEDEIVGYQWQESPDGKPVKELPIKVNDHAVDGLRYAIHYVAIGGAVTLPPARTRSVIG